MLENFTATVTRPNHDGDSLYVRVDFKSVALGLDLNPDRKIRLAGCNAPEIASKDPKELAAAKASRDYLAKLLPVGTKVNLRGCSLYKYGGATVANVILPNGKDVTTELIAAGHALPWDGKGTAPVTQYKLNWQPSPIDERDHAFAAAGPQLAKLPAEMDLTRLMPEHWDQGEYGLCYAFAGGAVMYRAMMINPTSADDYLPAPMAMGWWCCELDGTDMASDPGSYLRTYFKAAAKKGLPHPTLFPYDSRNWAKKPDRATTADAAKHKLMRYMSVKNDETSIKHAIAHGYPVAFGMLIYPDFMKIGADGRVKMPRKGAKAIGGHAMAVTGYSDSMKCFRVRNSWGSGFGAKGDVFVPYGYFAKYADDFWTATLTNEG